MGRERHSLFQRRNQRDFRPVVIAILLLFSISITNFSPTIGSSFPQHSSAISGSSQSQSVQQIAPTISHKSESRREIASSPATSGDPSSSPLTYHGGPIQVQQNVYLIFWLPAGQHFEPTGNDSNFEALISRYFNDIGGSQFYGILTQYPDTLDGSPTTSVHLAGAFVDSTPYPAAGTQSNPILGSQIIGQIQSYIGSGSIPVGIDSVFFVFTAYGINTCQDSGETLCSFATTQSGGYCAYHSDFQYGSSFVSYAEMGDSSDCQLSLSSLGATAYPNNDGIADSEINLVSQEQFDVASDPLQTSWYSGSSSIGEISDVCAGDYGSVNPTTGNTVLNKHNYIVQLEWSNSVGACTLSPPVTTSVTVTMTVNSGGTSLSAYNNFQLTFAIGKQLFVADYTGQPLQFSADPGTTLSVSAMSSASTGPEEWCLSMPCQPYTVNLGSGSQSVAIGYFDILSQTAIELTSGASGSPDTVSYYTAPSSPGSSVTPLAATLTLSSSSQTILALRGTTVSVPQQALLSTSSTSERWYTASQSFTVTGSYQLLPVQTYQQYLVSYGYQIAGGYTASTPPSVLYSSSGLPEVVNGGTSEWTDAGSQYYYPLSLAASSATERWEITPGTGTGVIGSAQSLEITYYEQFNVSLSYSIVGGSGSISGVGFSGQSFGEAVSLSANTNAVSTWLDAGSSFHLSNPISGSGSTERWYASSGTNGTISSSTLTISPTYYHQYYIAFSYSVHPTPQGNQSIPSQPSFLFSNVGSTTTLKLSTTAQSVWADAGSNYTVSPVTLGTNGEERWAAANGFTGVASQPGSTTFVLYNQYEVKVFSLITGGGSPGPAFLNMTAFGQPVSDQLANSTSQTLWIDAGTSYSLTNPISGGSSGERWIAPAAMSGTVNSPLAITAHYYHQYSISFSYTVETPLGINAVQPSLLFPSLNGTGTQKISSSPQAIWVNAGENYSLRAVGTNGTQRWASANGLAGNATQPGSVTFPLYYQLAVSFTILITGGGTPGSAFLNTTSFGQSSSIQVGNSTSPTLWLDAGSSYALTNPISSLNSASERWMASTVNASGVVDAPRIVSVHYYYQYLESLSYSVINGGSPGGPSVQTISAGTATSTPISNQSTSVWADAGSQYKFPSNLPGSTQSEAWNSNSSAASGVFNSASSVNIPYYHQYAATFNANTLVAQMSVSSNGWYDPGASFLLTVNAPSGWKFEGWSGTYSSKTPTLIVSMDSPVTETATFYTALVITASGSGSITYSFGNVTGTVGQGHTETVYVPPSQNVKITGSGFPVFFKFSGWSGNASLPLASPPASNKTKLNSQNPIELSINNPSSIIGEYAINLIGIGILAAIIVVAVVAVILFFRRAREPEVEEAELKVPQAVSAQAK